ncbi:MAG: amidohydrolase family protein [Alphaproteobacteria bacterium]|nr:amidohydrolase family protein [Alphaproteobacteria bacterium]
MDSKNGLPGWAPAAIVVGTFVLVWALIPGAGKNEEKKDGAFPNDQFPSTYAAYPSKPTLIRGATILTATDKEISNGDVLLKDGKIEAVGTNLDAPTDAVIVDGKGKFVTPGIIDIHSHLGVYPSPSAQETSDGNEATKPTTPEVRSENSVWPHDPGFTRALAGGVTAMQILPGSANLIGGRSVVLKNVPSRTTQGMKFPDAPYGLKMACGENPKRVYGDKGGPSTEMGNIAGYREAYQKAKEYRAKWQAYWKKGEGSEPDRDLGLETMGLVLDGKIRVQMHCYRADQMATMIDVSKEFGFHIAAFHHATEAYKVADLLRENNTCAVMWADWWGFKMEAYDAIPEGIAMVDAAGACAMIHSDDPLGIQRLNQEVAKAMAAGRRMGLNIPRAHAVAWMTKNPAKALGIDDKVGTIEPGKMADVVLWDRDPFSVYAHAEKVFIDGALMFDRDDPGNSPRSDFELGQFLDQGHTGGAGQ